MICSVLGCGRWGTFIAWYLNHIGKSVRLYGRAKSWHMAQLMETRKNEYLVLPDKVELTTDLQYAVTQADILIVSVGVQAFRDFLREIKPIKPARTPLVLCMKGLEEGTGKRLTQIVAEELGADAPCAIWVGPGHVQDFTRGVPNCMVLDSADEELKRTLVNEFSSDLIRFYYGDDLIGNEIGAAAKNVIGIAAGMLDGYELTSLKGALMARGTREIGRLIGALGGSERTAYGLSHLGDYEATVFSPYSHNRAFGEKFVRGQSYTQLAEGAATTKALCRLSEQTQVDLPICRAVEEVLYEGKDPKAVLSGLFLRSLKQEF